MAEFDELWKGGPVFAQAAHFRLGTDSVLLSDFVRVSGLKRGIDLGCASGAIALLLLSRTKKLTMTGLELIPEAAALARENMSRNSLSERSEIICGDIRNCRELFPSGHFDMVVSNPPYYSTSSGAVSPSRDRAGARSELDCSLEDVCSAAAYLCRTGGYFSMVGKPERLTEVITLMSSYGLEPKRLRFVFSMPDKPPSLFLIEGKRGACSGLTVERNLYLSLPDGTESPEYRKIYHRI